MFIAVLQEDLFALKGLVAALLHRDPEEITNIVILNPIELGVDINLKAMLPTASKASRTDTNTVTNSTSL